MRTWLLVLLMVLLPLQGTWAAVAPLAGGGCVCADLAPPDPACPHDDADHVVDACDGALAGAGCADCDAGCAACHGHVLPALLGAPVAGLAAAGDEPIAGPLASLPDPLPDPLLRPPLAAGS